MFKILIISILLNFSLGNIISNLDVLFQDGIEVDFIRLN
jgi:hypothetical protein